MRLKYPNLIRPDDWLWELSRNRNNYILCSASKCVSVSPFHADLLYTLHVPSVPASVTTTTIVSNNMTRNELMSLTEEYCQWCHNEYHFHVFTSDDGSLSIIYMKVHWTHIMKVWYCESVTSQRLKSEFACHRCWSQMPVTEMSTYQYRYNAADAENAEKR